MKLMLTVQRVENNGFIPSDAQFAQWIKAALHTRKENAEICIRLVGKNESAQLNDEYRHKEGPTNVISFPSILPPDLAKTYLLGDLVICVPLVANEAEAENKTILAHWAHLTIHGCLHLLGYDHELDNEAKIMEELETQLMIELGFPDPYNEIDTEY